MSKSIDILATKAVNAALAKNWKEAIEANKEILNFDDENIPTLNRISRAYIELSKYEEAKKYLKVVLRLDPINQTAKRNFEFARLKKKLPGNLSPLDLKNFIKEPGTTGEFKFVIVSKGLTAKDFFIGENLQIKVEGPKLSLYKEESKLIGIFDPSTSQKLIEAIRKGSHISASFIAGLEKEVSVLVKSSLPIFKAEKQEIKPYIKRDTLDEAELELAIPEMEES